MTLTLNSRIPSYTHLVVCIYKLSGHRLRINPPGRLPLTKVLREVGQYELNPLMNRSNISYSIAGESR